MSLDELIEEQGEAAVDLEYCHQENKLKLLGYALSKGKRNGFSEEGIRNVFLERAVYVVDAADSD